MQMRAPPDSHDSCRVLSLRSPRAPSSTPSRSLAGRAPVPPGRGCLRLLSPHTPPLPTSFSLSLSPLPFPHSSHRRRSARRRELPARNGRRLGRRRPGARSLMGRGHARSHHTARHPSLTHSLSLFNRSATRASGRTWAGAAAWASERTRRGVGATNLAVPTGACWKGSPAPSFLFAPHARVYARGQGNARDG